MKTRSVSQSTNSVTHKANIVTHKANIAHQNVVYSRLSSGMFSAMEPISTKMTKVAAKHKKSTQLPLWPDRVRGLPNTLARSALFTASSKSEVRTDFKRASIFSLKGFEIRYTGEELRQDDQDVWLQIAHIARSHPVGTEITVTGHGLLKALGWGRGKEKYERVRNSIARMREAIVWVSFDDGREGFTGNLIKSLKWETTTEAKWHIFLDENIINIFASDNYSMIGWEQRLTLTPLEKWLHAFWSTHREPLPYRVETLYRLCGSKTKLLRQFRYQLKRAMDRLTEAGFLERWHIDPRTDTVTVLRAKMLAE